jgi:hypothetical protein
VLIVLLVLAMTALACSSDEAPTTAAPIEQAADAFAQGIEPIESDYRVRATFQYDGFLVTVGDGDYDDTDGTLRLGLRFENLTDGWSSAPVSAAYTGPGVDSSLSVFADLVDVPPRRSIDLTAEVLSLPEAPDGSSRIAWGRDDRDQPIVAFDGEHENLWVPAVVDVDEWVGIGRYVVHLTRGVVYAGSLDGNVQNDPGLRTLRLYHDTYNLVMDPVNGFHPVEHFKLRPPDGELIEASRGSEGYAPSSWTATTDNWVEFDVDAHLEGDYEIELTSQSPSALGSLHPELIEAATVGFRLDAVEPGSPPDLPTPLPAPPEPEPDPEAPVDLPPPLELELTTAPINVGGFSFTPTLLTWDPELQEAVVTGDVEYLQTVTDEDPGGVLDVPPTFSFTAALASGPNLFGGTVDSLPEIPDEGTVEVDLAFVAVDELDPGDLGLYLGPRGGMVSSAALTPASPVSTYPPAPVVAEIDAEPAVAGDWTVELTGYRTGFLQSTTSPNPGRIELEIFLTVTLGPAATDRSSYLMFSPTTQLFLTNADGYLTEARRDSGALIFEPGQTKELSITFEMSDSFTAGRLGFALRSISELQAKDPIVETIFPADLGEDTDTDVGGGL